MSKVESPLRGVEGSPTPTDSVPTRSVSVSGRFTEPNRLHIGEAYGRFGFGESSAGAGRRGSPEQTHTGETRLIALLAERFPRGFAAREIAARIDDADDLVGAGDAQLKAALEDAGFWRPHVTGAVVGQWLARLVDRPAAGRVLRRARLIDGYRRYRVEAAP